jgi:SSS family solute:Na+ symporter
VVLIGVYLIVFGLFYYTPDVWKFLAGTGTIYLSGASAAVILGLYWRRASSAGAIAALLLGLLGVMVAFQEQFARSEWFQGIASESKLALITVGASWGAMILLSLLVPDRKPQARPARDQGGMP